LSKLKYPLYLAVSVFILLMMYSLSTEKPRQYSAKRANDTQNLGSITQIFGKNEDSYSSQDSNGIKRVLTNSDPQNPVLNESAAKNANSVVLAFSSNDAGGKIVLTQTKCEKAPSFVAYTTSSEGKIDYGCWTNDELYIFINWEKNGLSNYTFDKFVAIPSESRLNASYLSEATKDRLVLSKDIANQSTQVVASTNGGKK